MPGGHQHPVRPRPRQQRPHLRLRRGVIRDHQHRLGDLRPAPTGTARPAPPRPAGCAQRARPARAAAHPAPAPAAPPARRSRAGRGTAPRRGNQPAARAACPAWIASAVLPTPASPATADTTTAPAPAAGSSSPVTCASSASRPVNPATGAGSCASATGAAAAWYGHEGDVAEVPALQHRPVLGAAADGVAGLRAVRRRPLARARAFRRCRRRGRGRAEGQVAEVPALQHRPVLGAAADRIRDVADAGPDRLGLRPPLPAAPARTRCHRPPPGPAAPPPAPPPSADRPGACCNAASSASPDGTATGPPAAVLRRQGAGPATPARSTADRLMPHSPR